MTVFNRAKQSTTMDSQGLSVALYVCVLTCLFLQPVESLHCLTCSNVQNTTQCGSMTCQPNEKCFTYINNTASTTFTIGCKHADQCNDQTLTQTQPPAIIGRDLSSNDCHMCCSTDLCNRDLTTCSVKSQVTSRQCKDDPAYNCVTIGLTFDICGNKSHASKVCRHYCYLCDYNDGNWSLWSVWSTCVGTCDTGHRTRDRTCTNPAPANGGIDCQGKARDTSTCTLKECPGDGYWSPWSVWSTCDVTCDTGHRTHDRTCTNPAPTHGGKDCVGQSRDTSTCTLEKCPVHGGWTVWSSWSVCSVTCGVGLMSKDRSCSSPVPGPNGHPCNGAALDFQICSASGCVDGKWSIWSAWSSCTNSCYGGIKSRVRDCNNPSPSMNGRYCYGTNQDTVSCSTKACSDHPIIYFDAQYPSSIVNGRVVFTTTLYNEGSGYSTSTGKFICSIPGLYMFTTTFEIENPSSSYSYCYIRKNGSGIVRAAADAASEYNTGTATVYVKLNRGDYVDIGSCGQFDKIWHDFDFNFAGSLVTPS